MSQPHPNSVIPTSFRGYSEDFYDALVEKENYCYNSTRLDGTLFDPLTEYQMHFTSFVSSVQSYFNGNFSEDIFFDLLQGMNSFVRLNHQFGIAEDLKNSLYAIKIFNMGGVYETVVNQPVDYFDDIAVEMDDELQIEYTVTPRLNSASETASLAVESTNTLAQQRVSQISSNVGKLINKLLYHEIIDEGDDPPSVPYIVRVNPPFPKSESYDKVFVEYGYDTFLPFFGLGSVDPFN